MSIKLALLALLEQQPMYGYQLRTEFERRTGATWPLNVGQVYTTLNRLERDARVNSTGENDEGHTIYEITEAGRRDVAGWFETPVSRSQPPRDELAIKLALGVTLPQVDVETIIQRQRSATIEALQDYTRMKRQAADGTPSELAWSLVLDAWIFDAEAEIRWLDHCEARLRRAATERTPEPATPAAPSPNHVRTGASRS